MYIVTLIIISPIYLKGVIGAIINGGKVKNKQNKNLQLSDFKVKPYKKSYVLKEFTIIKRSPIFLIQCIIMPIIMALGILGISFALVIISKNIGFDIIRGISDKTIFTGVVLAINQILYMLNFSSIIAISKEKRWAVLSKYIPIKLSRQLNMKLFIGKLINTIMNLDIMIFYYICTKNIIYTLILILISYGLNSFGEKIKIFIDLKNPKIDWDNEYTMMKQATNVMYELFYTMFVIVVIILIGFIIQNINLYLITMLIMIFIINTFVNRYIYQNDNKIFGRLF